MPVPHPILAPNRSAPTADACGLTDRVRPQSRPAPVPNDRNKTADRPIPSENIVGDRLNAQLARAPLPLAPINWQSLSPRVPKLRMPVRHDEYSRKYRRDFLVPDSPLAAVRAEFQRAGQPFHNRPRKRRTTFG